MTLFSTEPDAVAFAAAAEFCRRFLAGGRPRYVLGRNSHAASIAEQVEIDGFLDDFTEETTFCGKPVHHTSAAPRDAMVVSAVLGKIWTAQRRLSAAGLESLDYYAFWKCSGLPVENPFFWPDFVQEFRDGAAAYARLHDALADETSQQTLRDLMRFRLTADITAMRGYVDRQSEQYFEPFLRLREAGETFVDVGGFDGQTSEEFIRRCPDYRRVHLFEPEPENMHLARQRLAGRRDIVFQQMGVSDRPQTLRLTREGSTSHISTAGEVEVRLEPLDRLIDEPVTFIKMDIEGAESAAIEGGAELIRRHRPSLAIAAYHRADDLRRLPEQVLVLHGDYELYLRHYTEGRDESVLFFVPRTRA